MTNCSLKHMQNFANQKHARHFLSFEVSQYLISHLKSGRLFLRAWDLFELKYRTYGKAMTNDKKGQQKVVSQSSIVTQLFLQFIHVQRRTANIIQIYCFRKTFVKKKNLAEIAVIPKFLCLPNISPIIMKYAISHLPSYYQTKQKTGYCLWSDRPLESLKQRD